MDKLGRTCSLSSEWSAKWHITLCFPPHESKNPSHLVTSDPAIILCNSSRWSPGRGIHEAMHSWVMTGLLGPLAGHLAPLYCVPAASFTGFSFLPIKIMFQALGWNFDSLLSWGHLETSLQKLDESLIRFKGAALRLGKEKGLKG